MSDLTIKECLRIIKQGMDRQIKSSRFSYPARSFETKVWQDRRIYINLFDSRGLDAGHFEVNYEPVLGKPDFVLKSFGVAGYNTRYEVERAFKVSKERCSLI